MAKILKVWIVNPADPNERPKFDTVARHVNDADVDTMEKQAIDNLVRDGYKVRTLNHCVDGNLVAYVYPAHLKAQDVVPISGWVFKRPDVPPTT